METNEPSPLAVLNSQMRRIDLLCKLIGPLAISLLDGLSTRIAILTTLGLSVVSVGVEYLAIAQVTRDRQAVRLFANVVAPALDISQGTCSSFPW
jgi:solute carrier family 40 (iron-regulated transporter), member 1